jgi:acyl-homoserine-lactone acylase
VSRLFHSFSHRARAASVGVAAWLIAALATHGGLAQSPTPQPSTAKQSPTAKKSSSIAGRDGESAPAGVAPVELLPAELDAAERLAAEVTIYRDPYGVPHIDGASDAAAVFGFAYAQAEDYFWQVEDSYILALGRYAEVHGARGLNSDLLNRAFEIVPKTRAAYLNVGPAIQSHCEAFAAGLNYYLATHPNVRPQLLTHFEPWQVMVFGRHILLELTFRRTGLSNTYLPRSHDMIWTAQGSNGWAIAPAKSASGNAMLLANPHLAWFGFSQLFEAHVRSAAGWDFAGAAMYGSPVFSIGHNDRLGWTLTTNEPDIADLWRLSFDDPEHPLAYRFDGGYRTATEHRETFAVRTAAGVTQQTLTLRRTHYGPVVAKEDDHTFLAARISGLDDRQMLGQSLQMMRARSLDEFRQALAMQQYPLMNIVYADQDGNIFYLYNGLVPRRDASFDWSQPVDGADPKTAWQGMLALDDLPQLLNPKSGYVQSCNSSPFTTTDEGNPQPDQFPRYLAEDATSDNRRAKRSRQILSAPQPLAFERLRELAFDTTVYWAAETLPHYAKLMEKMKTDNPALAAELSPYLDHLLDWDCRVTADSTAATLCEGWYAELYGRGYPGETMRPRYLGDPERQLRALAKAAGTLVVIFGDWRVKWGDAFRSQRHADVAEILEIPFDDRTLSFPCVGAPGPMGVIFTQYYTPSLKIPFIKTIRNRYALVGPTYLAAYEFGPNFRGATVSVFGTSGDPRSPHFQDQAELLAAGRLKDELFQWPAIAAAATEKYHPGQRGQ